MIVLIEPVIGFQQTFRETRSVKIHSILRHRRYRLKLLITIVLFAGTYSKQWYTIDLEKHSLHSLFIYNQSNEVSVSQMTWICTNQASITMGNLGLTWQRKLLLIKVNEAWKLEKIPIALGSDIASHPQCNCSLSIHKCDIQPQKDSNLVDSASSIRLSQRLSHACLSINKSIRETANGSLYQL